MDAPIPFGVPFAMGWGMRSPYTATPWTPSNPSRRKAAFFCPYISITPMAMAMGV